MGVVCGNDFLGTFLRSFPSVCNEALYCQSRRLRFMHGAKIHLSTCCCATSSGGEMKFFP